MLARVDVLQPADEEDNRLALARKVLEEHLERSLGFLSISQRSETHVRIAFAASVRRRKLS